MIENGVRQDLNREISFTCLGNRAIAQAQAKATKAAIAEMHAACYYRFQLKNIQPIAQREVSSLKRLALRAKWHTAAADIRADR